MTGGGEAPRLYPPEADGLHRDGGGETPHRPRSGGAGAWIKNSNLTWRILNNLKTQSPPQGEGLYESLKLSKKLKNGFFGCLGHAEFDHSFSRNLNFRASGGVSAHNGLAVYF